MAVKCYRVVWERVDGDSVFGLFHGNTFWSPDEALAWFRTNFSARDCVLIYRLQVGRRMVDMADAWYCEYYGLGDHVDDL